MGTDMSKALRWEINYFSERTDVMKSDTFSCGGCNWFLCIYARDDLSMYLQDVNIRKLSPGWKRRVSFCFVLLNQSGKELYRSPDEGRQILFCAKTPSWGVRKTFPLTKLQEKGFLEKNKLTIEVYIKVFEVVHQGNSTENDVLDYNGFNISASQARPLRDIFRHHPGFALDVIPKKQEVKTEYMNLLLSLMETLRKSPQSLSMTELRNAQSNLTALAEAGFKLDWLNSRLKKVFLERKKVLSDGSSWVKQLEVQVKNVELNLSHLKVELDKDMFTSIISSQHPDFAIDFIPMKKGTTTLVALNLLRGLTEALRKCPRSVITELKEAGFDFDLLNSRLEELSDGTWIKQLEEQVKNVEQNLSDLKVELDKERIKSIKLE